MRRRRRGFMLILLTAVVVGCAAASGESAIPGAASDVRLFADELERIHPNPYHAVSREEFRRQVDELAARADGLERDELIVGLMRLMGNLGERDGHSGIYTLHSHPKPMRLFPVRVYWFVDGLAAVGGRGVPVGAKLVAVGGVPIDDVVARVRPLITRDNEWSFRERVPYYLVCAEVLHGLGLAPTFTFETQQGRRDVTPTAVAAAQYADEFPYFWQAPAPPAGAPRPLWVRYRGTAQAVTTLQRGRVLYVAYTQTTDSWDLSQRILRLARKKAFRRLVVDIRQNGGGNNQKYWPLLDAIKSKVVNRHTRPVLLTGRTTFSAAGNFAADVERFTRARIIGEPPGGSPSQWGDFAPVTLPHIGLEALVATQYVQSGRPGDTRAALEPAVRVEASSADWLAGRDPALAAALGQRANRLLAGRTATRPKPPKLGDYCLTRVEKKAAIRFKASDGAMLLGLTLGPRASRRGVVFAHEGAGGLCNWMPYARRLARIGYRVLAFDLRGFVSSPATRRRQGRHDLDVVGAVRELRRRGASRVAVVGGSLGAMAAVAAAPQIAPPAAGIIVASPGLAFRGLDAGAAAPGVRVPALFIASTDDGEFPASTRTIYERVASEDKRLVLVPGTKHGYELVLGAEGAANRALFEDFLARHLAG